MDKYSYGFGEQNVLDKFPKAIDNVRNEIAGVNVKFNNKSVNTDVIFASLREDSYQNEGSANGRVSSMVRVRMESGKSGQHALNNNNLNDNSTGYYELGSYNGDFNSNIKGSSFVLVIVALIALIAIVAVVTLGIIKAVGI